MVKKGKVKATAPTPSQASAASKDGNGGASGSGSGTGKGKKGQKGAAGSDAAPEAPPAAAPKPTVKQLIGGSSWTGKLPVNLLSEHCQKQKWDRPVYDTRKTAEGFSVWVTLSARDPKTQQTTTLEPFKIPATHKHLLLRETALEAKHAAATYALFRVCSMQNKHTVLPPDYKALWKDFQALKAQDVKDGKAWMYEADPFRALLERQESKAAAEKKRREVEQAKAKARDLPGAAGLVLLSGTGSGSVSNAMKGWTSVPKVEMGRQTRIQLEALLRDGVTWNPHGVTMPPAEKKSVVAELSKLGFRQSHVAEAVEYCKDRQETLEWLLIHVPEDDLPRWALPEKYSAGVTIGATDLKREGTIQRLSQTGYSVELCTRVLDEHGGNEDVAAEALQNILLPASASNQQEAEESGGDFLDFGTPQEQWDEEVATLESIYGNNFRREGDNIIQIRLESVKDAQNGDVETFLQVRRGSSYPRHLILGIIAKLPSYIKLSIVKRMLAHIEEDLKEEPAKIYLVVDWIQHNINGIIANPGKLLDISAVSSAASETRPAKSVARNKRSRAPPRPLKWIADNRSKEEWLRRQGNPAQREMITKRQALPAWQMQDAIVQTVNRNQVTIISGETGSGKSTQSVQFLLDDLYEKGLGGCANMIVTQPRRISALGLADRVAEERCSRVGGEVGYAIRGESRQSRDTRITFVTTGVLLRRLQTSGGRVDDVVASLADVSHIIIDEVHERSLDTDFLLNLLREVMIQKKDMLKLVLMSATLDAATFKSYFESEGLSVGTVEIAGRTYPVEEFHLDDVIRMTGFGVDGPDDGSFIGDETMGKVIQKLGHRINYSLITEAVKAIDYELSYEKKTGGILIFLPGVGEINQACNSLRSISSLHVLPLHASLETKEQKRVFSSPPPGKRKVVVATNVAETSITIDDIVVVIDSGKVKETSFDPQTNMRKLEETWASQAACKQRQGRAGRVQAGKCFKLFTQNLEQNMAPRPEPEIRRVPLEQLCLSVRAMGMKDVIRFLGRSPTPPATPAIEGAMALLRRMGALDGDELTAMGQQLAMLPADLRCGKLMVFGAIFGCLDDCITIAAILSTRSPFFAPQEKRDEAREARMRFYRGDGDPLTDLEAFTQWDEMMRDRGTPQREVRRFCDDNFLSFQTLTDIANTRSQYYDALTEIGIHSASSSQGPGGRNTLLLRALVASAFTPQIARIQYPDKKFAASVSGAVELDPEARAIKYFCQEAGRVFVHPSSTLFGSQGFSGNAAYMSYFSMISTTKIFIRDLTPLNAYTLLMFCGPIELDTLGRGLLVDGWLRLRGWARLGVLVARLRAMVDSLIADKVENPGLDLAGSKIIKLVIKMIELNGLDAIGRAKKMQQEEDEPPSKRAKQDAFAKLMAPKQPPSTSSPSTALKPPSSKPSHPFKNRMALGAYIESPSSFPPSVVIYHNDDFVVIHDKFPKATVHTLLLPRSPRHRLLHPFEALQDEEFLGKVRAEVERLKVLAAGELQRKLGRFSRSDARREAVLNGEVELEDDDEAQHHDSKQEHHHSSQDQDPNETTKGNQKTHQKKEAAAASAETSEPKLPQGRNWLAEIRCGVHAVPSMGHMHVHVFSRDMHSPYMKHRKHYNSFNTPFLVDIADFPLAKEDIRRGRGSREESFMKRDLVCWRCGRNFGNRFKELKGHLEDEFEEWKRE